MKMQFKALWVARIGMLVAFLLLLWGPGIYAASSVTFEWDTNSVDQEIQGYRLYQSDESGQYYITVEGEEELDPSKMVKEILTTDEGCSLEGPICTTTLESVIAGTWYWVLTAFNEAAESGVSEEVFTTITDIEDPGEPNNFKITIVVKVVTE